MAYEPPLQRNGTIDSLCMEIAELVGMLSPQVPLAESPTLHRELRIQAIRSSPVIEENTLDERTIGAVLDGKPVSGDSRDILEVENAKHAYDLIPGLNPYSIDDLLRAHRVMMEGLVPEAGCFRNGNVGVLDGDILIHTGTPTVHIPEVMAGIFGWLKKTNMHPLLASCAFHFEFGFYHPFLGGNGRTNRLWHTSLLSRWRPMLAWLPVESTIRRHQAGYYGALAKSDVAGSGEEFVGFMLDTIRESLLPFPRPESERELARSRVLDFFREHSDDKIPQLAKVLGCSKRSAERMVAGLKEKDVLSRQRNTRSGIWAVHEQSVTL